MLHVRTAGKSVCSHLSVRSVSAAAAPTATIPKIYRPDKIGDREVVGYGANGRPIYIDTIMFPFPAIKFSRPTAEFKALEEKAKGDWKNMTIAEKKRLYRLNFCQTLAEVEAPTGELKSVIGFSLMWVSLALWLHLFVEWAKYSDGGKLPETFSEENQKAQLRRMLDLQVNPVSGISSKWDYEKNMWKKDVPKDA
ncbi:cytochrome C oxidase [Nesidiocoris tenuis]|uniref:Cytochrome c oxidase subunit 4 n=1 Tax=Nesidiocoris tenuis TaxID=355587 RepID=A0ABN7AVT8_9HEMI|nr:cytochrome C oxidase [Nesidiocoris tenuis]